MAHDANLRQPPVSRFARALPRPTSTVALVLGAALVAWIVTVERMRGMDMGPGTDLGGVGWVGFPSGLGDEGYGTLYSLSPRLQVHFEDFLEIWDRIGPRLGEK